MIEIWTEFDRFKAIDQKLADQVMTITKNGWFSDLEILEIHQQIYSQTNQQPPITVTETIDTGKPETPNQTLHENDSYTANTQGTAPINYRSISCLPMIWKILTAQIRDIYYSLVSRGIFLDEQKGCRKRTRDTVVLLYIDQNIPNESKTRRKNLARV